MPVTCWSGIIFALAKVLMNVTVENVGAFVIGATRKFFVTGLRLPAIMAESKRTLEQNAKFHAICNDIAQQKQWAGMWIDAEGYKRLFVDAWARHEGKTQGKIVPSLDGQSVVNLGIQTRRMRVADMADLITFAEVYCIEHGIVLRDS